MRGTATALSALLLAQVAGCDRPRCDMCYPSPRTHLYVVSVLRIPEATGTMAYGFDLDGVSSTGEGTSCVDVTPDFDSINDPGETGVDNGLAVPTGDLEPPLIDDDALIAEQIASGSLLMVIEVSGIDSYRNDSSVVLRLMRGSLPEGSTPRLEPDGTLSPGQDFMPTAIAPGVAGSITNGRLRAETDALDLTIDAGGDVGMITLTLHDAQIRANISQTRLANGVIGGAIVIEELAAIAERIMEGYGDIVRSEVEGDLQPDPADETRCLAISTGISFTAVDHVDDFDDATD